MPLPHSPKAAVHSLWCKNVAVIALGLLVFEVGVFTGRAGFTDRKILFQRLNHTLVEHVRVQRHLPLSLQNICPLTRASADAQFHAAHNFSQPLVIKAYFRLNAADAASLDLVLISTGVSMGTFVRGFEAAGCMVGRHVLPVDSFAYDRTVCTVPKHVVTPGLTITLVLHRDRTLKEAMRGPVEIQKEFVARLEPGDLGKLHDDVVLHGSLEHSRRQDLVPIASKIVYDGQLDEYDTTQFPNIPRYEMCVATQIKPSLHLLPDWIDYHRKLGFDFVYIFDNDAEEDLRKTYQHRHDVEVIYWPWDKSQLQAFTFAAFALRARCEWLLLIDSDEYIMVGLEEDFATRDLPPIKEYVRMRHQEGYAQIWFHWVIMKNSGFEKTQTEPVPEVYIHREDPQLRGVQTTTLGKTMMYMDKAWINSNAHSRRPGEKAKMFDDRTFSNIYPSKISDTAMIVHYRRRSWEEYQEKLRSGRANVNNPSSYSSLMRRDSLATDDNKKAYMAKGRRNSKLYTHFREIWRRVSAEMRVGSAVTVRYKEGERCRTVYDLARSDFWKPLRGETCA